MHDFKTLKSNFCGLHSAKGLAKLKHYGNVAKHARYRFFWKHFFFLFCQSLGIKQELGFETGATECGPAINLIQWEVIKCELKTARYYKQEIVTALIKRQSISAKRPSDYETLRSEANKKKKCIHSFEIVCCAG